MKSSGENNFEEQNNILPVETSPPLDNISIKSSKGPPLGFGPSGTEYSLVYFGGVRNKAEPVRLILNYYGIPYEDRFVSFDEWPKLKPGEK